jgi:hypothetical protein
MKITKIIACLLAVISAISMLVACDMIGGGETTPAPTVDPQEQVRYKANVNLIVTDHKGNVVYATDEEEPHQYDSGFEQPYIFTFIEDFAFFNTKEFAYEINSRNTGKVDEYGDKIKAYTLESITITQKKKSKTYAADTTITYEVDGKKYETQTYWVFYVNGVEVNDANAKLGDKDAVILKTGDTLEIRLSYNDEDRSNPVVETPAE